MNIVDGYYINLDASIERKDLLVRHLSSLGLEYCYKRFPALTPSLEEREHLRGLRTVGELGIWKSFVALLSNIPLNEDLPEFVHIIEDDIRLNANFPRIMLNLFNFIGNDANFKKVDLIFLDYTLDTYLFEMVLAQQSANSLGYYQFLDGSFYLACLSSFLVRRSSIPLILEHLGGILNSQSVLLPIDIMLRKILENGYLNAQLLFPLISAPAWDLAKISTIQDPEEFNVYRSMLAYLLLKICLSEVDSPSTCCARLADLFGETASFPEDVTKSHFFEFFKSLQPQMTLF
jgi:hypothetical protein